MQSICLKLLPCCSGRRHRDLAAAAETELLLASIDSLSARLHGLRTNLRTAEAESRSADQAELRDIRREHEAENRRAMEAVRELGAVEQRLLEAQTAMQQTQASLGRAQRRRDQLRDELQVGEESVRSAESGITQAKGVAEQVLVALKQKIYDLEETLRDHTSMEDMYATQITSLTAQVDSMEQEAAGQIDTAGDSTRKSHHHNTTPVIFLERLLVFTALKSAIHEFAASSDFEIHFPHIASVLHLTPTEERRVMANRQRQLDDDPEDPR